MCTCIGTPHGMVEKEEEEWLIFSLANIPLYHSNV
jgi:hypothetical protein